MIFVKEVLEGVGDLLRVFVSYSLSLSSLQTMVSLMGANFSKPLVASKVTHLVCFKFEGMLFSLFTWTVIVE